VPAQSGALRPASGDEAHEHEGASHSSQQASNPAHVVAAPASDAHPERVLVAAVKRCTLSNIAAADVRVTVSTKLTLRVGEDGTVTFARFDPPLAPDAQACASRAIYKTRFAPSGAEGPREVTIPIDVERAR
jgi:hypothetical protein